MRAGNNSSPCSCFAKSGASATLVGTDKNNLCSCVWATGGQAFGRDGRQSAACLLPCVCPGITLPTGQASMHILQRLPTDPYCAADKREHSQWFYFRVSNCADETLNVSLLGWAALTLAASSPVRSNATACFFPVLMMHSA